MDGNQYYCEKCGGMALHPTEGHPQEETLEKKESESVPESITENTVGNNPGESEAMPEVDSKQIEEVFSLLKQKVLTVFYDLGNTPEKNQEIDDTLQEVLPDEQDKKKLCESILNGIDEIKNNLLIFAEAKNVRKDLLDKKMKEIVTEFSLLFDKLLGKEIKTETAGEKTSEEPNVLDDKLVIIFDFVRAKIAEIKQKMIDNGVTPAAEPVEIIESTNPDEGAYAVDEDEFDDQEDKISTATTNIEENEDVKEGKDAIVDRDETPATAEDTVSGPEIKEGTLKVAVTKDKEVNELWQKMLKRQLISGGEIVTQDDGSFKLIFSKAVFPGRISSIDEFYIDNFDHEQRNPGYFKTRKDPRQKYGKYFPEEIFLDKSGKALNLYLDNRFDRFKQTMEGKRYYSRQNADGALDEFIRSE